MQNCTSPRIADWKDKKEKGIGIANRLWCIDAKGMALRSQIKLFPTSFMKYLQLGSVRIRRERCRRNICLAKERFLLFIGYLQSQTLRLAQSQMFQGGPRGTLRGEGIKLAKKRDQEMPHEVFARHNNVWNYERAIIVMEPKQDHFENISRRWFNCTN